MLFVRFFGREGALLTRPTPGVGNTHADNSLTRSKGKVQRLTLQTFSSRVERGVKKNNKIAQISPLREATTGTGSVTVGWRVECEEIK